MIGLWLNNELCERSQREDLNVLKRLNYVMNVALRYVPSLYTETVK